VVASCPVCSTETSESTEHCPKCGFPRSLAARLDGPVPLPADPEAGLSPEAAGPPARPSASAGPEAEVNASIARALEERMELLLTIDRDVPDVTGELCEAALNEASGRITDAQQVLRSAQARLDQETEELLGRHLENLEARGRVLQATGLRLALEDELGRLAETIVAGNVAASVAALSATERRLDSIEAHWRGLQGLFAQVTSLRAQATDLGIHLDGLPDRLVAARASLSSMPVTEHDLDVAAQAAAETLMHLHEAIPPALESELRRHAQALEGRRGRAPRLQTARRRQTEAVQHLKSGRLEDAVRSVRELRTAVEELAREAEEVPTAPPPPVPVAVPEPPAGPATVPTAERSPGPQHPGSTAPPEAPGVPRAPGGRPPGAAGAAAPPTPDAATVDVLMKKARSLAVRVRSLPADSEEASIAARQIHEATELLRQGQFAAADEALSRLMRALVGAGSRS